MIHARDMNGIDIERGDIVYVEGRYGEDNRPIEYDALDIQRAKLDNDEYLTFVVIFNHKDGRASSEELPPSSLQISPYSLAHRKANAGLLSTYELQSECPWETEEAARLAIKNAGVNAEVVSHYGSFTHEITIRDIETKEPYAVVDVFIDKEFLERKREAIKSSYCKEGFIDILSLYFKERILASKSRS